MNLLIKGYNNYNIVLINILNPVINVYAKYNKIIITERPKKEQTLIKYSAGRKIDFVVSKLGH